MKHERFIKGQWTAGRTFAFFWVLIVPLIVLGNFTDAYERGAETPWNLLLIGFAMLLFGLAVVEICRRWFNIMLGGEVCTWRKQR